MSKRTGLNFAQMGLEPVSAELVEGKRGAVARITCKKGEQTVYLYAFPVSLSPEQRSALKLPQMFPSADPGSALTGS